MQKQLLSRLYACEKCLTLKGFALNIFIYIFFIVRKLKNYMLKNEIGCTKLKQM